MTRTASKVSDEVLLDFMKEVREDVKHIKDTLTPRVAGLEVKFDERDKSEIKKAVLITIILFLVGLIGGLLGYIWGKENNNQHEQRIESIQKDVKEPFERR